MNPKIEKGNITQRETRLNTIRFRILVGIHEEGLFLTCIARVMTKFCSGRLLIVKCSV